MRTPHGTGQSPVRMLRTSFVHRFRMRKTGFAPTIGRVVGSARSQAAALRHHHRLPVKEKPTMTFTRILGSTLLGVFMFVGASRAANLALSDAGGGALSPPIAHDGYLY